MSNIRERAKNCPELLRAKRKRLFKAFDIYKENVNYGLVEETQETHNKLVQWYQGCLDLDANAIDNCPNEIKPYMKGE